MTLKQALIYAKGDDFNRETWKQAEAVIVAANLCPFCACHGEKNKLGKWQPGNYQFNAGRECFTCEQFTVCGPQPEFCGAESSTIDSDPGL